VRLYHLTREKHLEGIAEQGLLPTVSENVIMTVGIPAVWLSANRYPDWTLHFHTDACLLTVEPRKKRLCHWRTWMAGVEVDQRGQRFRAADLLAELDRVGKFKNSDAYWVHFGAIPRSRIKHVELIRWCGENAEVEAALREHQQDLGKKAVS
jgi:hypothetical protein